MSPDALDVLHLSETEQARITGIEAIPNAVPIRVVADPDLISKLGPVHHPVLQSTIDALKAGGAGKGGEMSLLDRTGAAVVDATTNGPLNNAHLSVGGHDHIGSISTIGSDGLGGMHLTPDGTASTALPPLPLPSHRPSAITIPAILWPTCPAMPASATSTPRIRP